MHATFDTFMVYVKVKIKKFPSKDNTVNWKQNREANAE